MKIILALDHSDCSSEALRWVRRVEWPAGSRVIVVSAVGAALLPISDAFAPEAEVTTEIHDQQVKASRALVQKAVRSLREIGMPAEWTVANGDARDQIVELARHERADLIVVGSHGRTGLTKLMLGSVSSHIVTHAPCTVVVVKQSVGAEMDATRRES